MKTYFDGADRQRALSYWSIGSWGGSGICSFAGGAIATYMGWRWIFIISIVFALLGMLLIKGTPESKVVQNTKAKFDSFGLVLFVIAMVCLNLIITRGATFGWTSPITITMLVVFLVSAGLFFRVELRQANGFIDFSLFKNKAYTGATLSNFLLNRDWNTGCRKHLCANWSRFYGVPIRFTFYRISCLCARNDSHR